MSKYSINVYADDVVIEDITLSSKVAFPRSGYMVNFTNEEILLLDSDSNFVAKRFKKVSDIDSITDNRSGSPVSVTNPVDLPALFVLLRDYFIAGTSVGDVSLGDIVVNTADIENLLQGIAGSVETPAILNTTSAGSVAAGVFSVSFYNKGTTDATILGAPLVPGATLELCAKTGNTLAAIAYVASATSELQIITTTIV